MSHPKVLLQSCWIRGLFGKLCFPKPAQKFLSFQGCFKCSTDSHSYLGYVPNIKSPLRGILLQPTGSLCYGFSKGHTHTHTQEIFPPLMGLGLTLLDVQTSVCAKPELLSSPCFPCAKLVIPLYYTVWFSSMNGFTRGSRELIQCTRTLKSDSFD